MKFIAGEGALGDKLAIMYLLENHGRISRETHLLLTNALFKSIYNLFKFEHVELVSNYPTRKDVNIFKDIHRGWLKERNFVASVCRFFCEELALSPYSCEPLQSKILEYQQEDITLVQFDGRTSRRHGVGMNKEEIKLVMGKLANYRVVVLGGPDTRKYLGNKTEYRIGGLRFLVKHMMRCKEFVGCDSGLSHLAGIVGVPSKIVILHKNQGIENAYKIYQNTLVYKHNLKLLNSKIYN
jgi:hypothetical protein